MTERVVFDCDGCGKSNVEVKRLRAIEAAAKEWLAAQEHRAAIKAAIHRGEYCGERAASPDWLLAWQRYWAAEDRLREVLK